MGWIGYKQSYLGLEQGTGMEPAAVTPRVESVALILMPQLPGISGYLTAPCISILGNDDLSLVAQA